MNGQLTLGEPLTEPEYGLQVLAVKLKRRVQMYQWIEETVEHKFGESVASIQTEDRTYYYTMDWSDRLVDSRNFYIRAGHHNPTKLPLENRIQMADHVNIGHYELGASIKNRVDTFTELTSDSRPEDSDVKLHSGLYYHCNDVWNPEIGDIRVQFSFAGLEGEYFTVVGKLEKGVIVPYETSLGTKVLLMNRGELSLLEAFKAEHHSQKLTTWGFRLFGWILLFLSSTCLAPLLHYIFSHNRFLAMFAPDPNYPVSANFMLSFSFALFLTSVAWALYRPWLGAGLLFAAFSPFFYCARGVAHYQRVN